MFYDRYDSNFFVFDIVLHTRTLKLSNASIPQLLLQRLLLRSPRPVKSRVTPMTMTRSKLWAKVEGFYSLPPKASSRNCNTSKRPEERR